MTTICLTDVEKMKNARNIAWLIVAAWYPEDPNIRRAAVEAIGQVGDRQSTGLLIDHLRDSDEGVRRAAAKALGEVGDGPQAAKLLKPIVDDPDVNVRRAGIEAAVRIAGRPPQVSQRAVLVFKVAFFLLGAFLWAVAFGLVSGLAGSSDTVTMILATLPIIFLSAMGMKGWDWFSQYKSGTVGNHLKFIAFLLTASTGIGLIPICYWTGKGLARWLNEHRA